MKRLTGWFVTPGVLVACFFGATAWGQELEGLDEGEMLLEEVIVKGTKNRPKPSDRVRDRRDNPHAKVIAGREEIEAFGDLTAGDVLKRLPGLYMGGEPGENGDIRLRGLDKEYTQILVDGKRIPGGGEKGEFELDKISADMIERVEIIHNPTAEFDHDAVGGIVNIVLREPPESMKVNGTIATGGQEGESLFDRRNLALQVGSRAGRLRYQVGGGYLRTPRVTDKTKETTDGDTETEHRGVDRVVENLNLTFTYDLNPQDQLSVHPVYMDTDEVAEKENVSGNAAGNVDREHESKNAHDPRVTVGWTHRYLNEARLTLTTTFARHDEEKDKTTEKFAFVGGSIAPTSTQFEREEKEDQEWIANLKLQYPWAMGQYGHLFTAGIQFRDKDRTKRKTVTEVFVSGTTVDTTGPKDNYDLKEQITALFVQDEIGRAGRLFVIPGLRAEFAHGDFFDLSSGGTSPASFTTTHPSVHVLYKLDPSGTTNLRGSFARAMRRPKFDELIPTYEETADRIKLGNPLLAPEISYNFEAQIDRFWNGGFGSVGGFYRQVYDKIESVIVGVDTRTGKDIEEPVNVGDGRIFGVEVELESSLQWTALPMVEDVTLRGNAAWLDSEIHDVITGQTRPFKDQPNYMFNLILLYLYRPWGTGVNIAWNYIGERIDPADDGTNKVEAPLSTVDLSAKQRIGKYWALFLDVKNVLHEKKVKEDGGLEVQSIPTVYLFGVRGSM
jgi:iron complex outermembrane receptor protein